MKYTNRVFREGLSKIVLTLLLIVVSGLVSVSVASTVNSFTVEGLSKHSKLVVDGTVIDVKPRYDKKNSRIHTIVTLKLNSIVLGDTKEKVISLSYLGGVIEGKGLRVAGMTIPKIGDEGIFFIENPERTQVHPLMGWAQGHFVIKKDTKGERKVLTSSERPIKSVNKGQKEKGFRRSNGIAMGIQLGTDGIGQSISAQQFIKEIQSISKEVK